MSIEMSHFCVFVRRQDYVRAAYWLAKIEKDLDKDTAILFTNELINATYREPDYKKLLKALDSLVK